MEENTVAAEISEPWEMLTAGLKTWEEFEPIEQERLVRHYAPRIRHIALRLKARMPAHVELGDLISSGTLGLLDALSKFRASLTGHFETYADNRIRGAMLDELRELDWMPRKLRAKMRRLESAMEQIESSQGRIATEEDLREATGMPLRDVREILQAIQSNICVSLDMIQEQRGESLAATSSQPQDEVIHRDLAAKLYELIESLSPREKLILSLYYVEECNMREVAAILNLSEGRVSQLHSEMLENLKRKFIRRHGRAAFGSET